MGKGYGDVTFQNAAAATANGVAANVEDYAILGAQVTGTFVGTITFEGSADGTNYVALEAINTATGAKATTATAAGVYRMSVAGLQTVRARLAWTSGTSITVVGHLTMASDAIIQALTLAANSGVDIGDVDVATINAVAPQFDTTDRLAVSLYGNQAAAGDTPVLVDAAGNLQIDVATITAGETHIGEVGGKITVVSANPVLTVAGAYSSGDYVGTSATAIAFANAVRVSGGSGVIHAALLTDKAVQSISTELWLFDTAITSPTDNAAWSLSDAHAATHIGVIPFSTYYASALNSVSCVKSVGLPFKATATTIYGALVTRGTPTYTSLDLTIRLVIMQD